MKSREPHFIYTCISDGYAPFSSMTSRDTHFNLQDTAIAAPGPGQYDNHLVREHVKVRYVMGHCIHEDSD